MVRSAPFLSSVLAVERTRDAARALSPMLANSRCMLISTSINSTSADGFSARSLYQGQVVAVHHFLISQD